MQLSKISIQLVYFLLELLVINGKNQVERLREREKLNWNAKDFASFHTKMNTNNMTSRSNGHHNNLYVISREVRRIQMPIRPRMVRQDSTDTILVINPDGYIPAHSPTMSIQEPNQYSRSINANSQTLPMPKMQKVRGYTQISGHMVVGEWGRGWLEKTARVVLDYSCNIVSSSNFLREFILSSLMLDSSRYLSVVELEETKSLEKCMSGRTRFLVRNF